MDGCFRRILPLVIPMFGWYVLSADSDGWFVFGSDVEMLCGSDSVVPIFGIV